MLNESIIADQKIADSALKKIEPKPKSRSALVVDERPWYGASAVPIQNGAPLPPLLLQPDGVVMTFERPLQFREVARSIQASTGIRVIVEEGTAAAAGGSNASLRTFIPVDGVEVSGGRIVWQGALPSLLDQISDTFDSSWRYDGHSIVMSEEVTRTFMLHALADSIDFIGNIQNVADEAGVLPEVEIDSTATLEIWGEIKEAIASIIGTRGRASFSPSTGTVTISGPPSLVERAETYLREQNRLRLRRVAVAVRVLSVETSDTNTLGFDFNGVLERIVDNRPFQFSAVGDGLTAGILRATPELDPITGMPLDGGTQPDTDEIASILEADEEITRVSLSNSGAVVTLSDIPAPLQIGRTVAYLERISSSGGEEGNVSLEPGEVNLGLTMNVLPRVIQRDRVLLRLAIGITDAETPFRAFEAGALRVELPEVETTGFLQNAVLAEGETLVIAGFEKNQSTLTDEGVPGGLWTGGTRTMGRAREVTVLLITAEVLPEEPLTVIGE